MKFLKVRERYDEPSEGFDVRRDDKHDSFQSPQSELLLPTFSLVHALHKTIEDHPSQSNT
jgi:hypothetical protein